MNRGGEQVFGSENLLDKSTNQRPVFCLAGPHQDLKEVANAT
jgi:hypothetical protein